MVLDSLAGTVDRLEETSGIVCLVSHQSQLGTIRTQNRLFDALRERYPGRLAHYKFRCSLSGQQRREESQRTRSFLYTSIAFAVAQASGLSHFYVYENGITSINFARREDVSNATGQSDYSPKDDFTSSGTLFALACIVQRRFKRHSCGRPRQM